MFGKTYKSFPRYLFVPPLMFVLVSVLCGCGVPRENQTEQEVVHVAVDGDDTSGKGTLDAPYATVSAAASAAPASIIVVHEGDYGPIQLGSECSGNDQFHTIIRPAEDEKVLVHAQDGIGISLLNVSNITVEGLEIEGGTHGIYFESTREAGHPLTDIQIKDCTVRGVRGTHGICAYARNDLAPVQGLTIEGCEVYDCECGDSESVVLNGNIDGFAVRDNVIHDNNNIGIDMIGFEDTAKHPDEDDENNAYEFDMVRNGVCANNVIYNISTEGNPAYFEDGEYDLCADGIYVDGGQDIEIYNNFVFNCDIGLEVATEHSPDENELFRVSGVQVHDNVIADCTGWAGICFGGYDKDLGFTEACVFEHNTLVDNSVQLGVQRSRDNRISANLIVGGETAVEFNDYCSDDDMVNDISGNACCEIEDEESWTDEFGPTYQDRAIVVDGFRSLIDNVGSSFVPDEKLADLYTTQMAESR